MTELPESIMKRRSIKLVIRIWRWSWQISNRILLWQGGAAHSFRVDHCGSRVEKRFESNLNPSLKASRTLLTKPSISPRSVCLMLSHMMEFQAVLGNWSPRSEPPLQSSHAGEQREKKALATRHRHENLPSQLASSIPLTETLLKATFDYKGLLPCFIRSCLTQLAKCICPRIPVLSFAIQNDAGRKLIG